MTRTKRALAWVLIVGSACCAVAYLGIAVRDAMAILHRTATPDNLNGLGVARYLLILVVAVFAVRELVRDRALPALAWVLMALWIAELLPGVVFCAAGPDPLCAMVSLLVWKFTTLAVPLLYILLVWSWSDRAFRMCSIAAALLMGSGAFLLPRMAPPAAATQGNCDRLKDQVEREDCYKRLAVERQDVALCAAMEKWPSADGQPDPPELVRQRREGCERDVYIKKDDPSRCALLQGFADRDICFADIAQQRRDPALCAEVRDQTYQGRCKRWAAGDLSP